MELENDVAILDHFAGGEVADPVVREVGADQDELSGREQVDVVADDESSLAGADEMDLEFGVVVPPGYGAWHVVHVPSA